MGDRLVCACNEGYASEVDGNCCFCREKLYSRAYCKEVGVRYRGAGMTLDQEDKILAKHWASNKPRRQHSKEYYHKEQLKQLGGK